MSLLPFIKIDSAHALPAKPKTNKPSAPTVVSISSSAATKGKIDLNIVISLPVLKKGQKITGSKISVDGKSCTLNKLKKSCTIKGIKNGKLVVVKAASRNLNGFGKSSKSVRYKAGSYRFADSKFYANLAESCKLPVADGRGDNSIGAWPRIKERSQTVGTVNATVIMVDFPDAPATMTPAEALALISPGQEVFTEMSYGKLNYVLNPQLKWYRMGKNSNSYFTDSWTFDQHRNYIKEAAGIADPEVDFSATESLIVIANPSASGLGDRGPAFTPTAKNGITLDGKYISNGATSASDLPGWGHLWLNHEVAHTLGLPDLYAYETNRPGIYEDFHRYVGGFSYMGIPSSSRNAPSLLAFERWNLGWINDSQITCMTGKQVTSTISPVQATGGNKAVVVPLTRTKAIVIESRRPLGIDRNLNKSGALIYLVDSSIQSGLGPVQIFPKDLSNDPWYLNAPRTVGDSLTLEGVTIEVIASDENGDTVSVRR
jgi:M6 family metalloprotease-like protein